MNATKRDPRIDPQPGDVLKHRDALCGREVIAGGGDEWIRWVVRGGRHDSWSSDSAAMWRKWAVDTEVIAEAPDAR